MKKSTLVLFSAVVATVACIALASAGAKELKGKVTAAKGNTVTIELTEGTAADLPEGSLVEIQVKEQKAKPPKAGKDMLQGC